MIYVYRNFHILKLRYSFIVKADSPRFGEQEIVYEHYDHKKCLEWIFANYRNSKGEIITNMRWTDRVYRIAMSTCEVPNNPWFNLEKTVEYLRKYGTNE